MLMAVSSVMVASLSSGDKKVKRWQRFKEPWLKSSRPVDFGG